MSKAILSRNSHGDGPTLRTYKWLSDKLPLGKWNIVLKGTDRDQIMIHRCTA